MSALVRILLILLLSLSASPAVAHEGASTDDPEDSSSVDAPAEDDDPVASEERLLEAASSITDQVADIRGLGAKSSIPKGVKDRQQLREMLVDRFHDEMSPEEFEAEARVYRRLGLLGDDIEYRELMLDLLTEQIAGFYDQDTGELYIMTGLPEALQRSTMAHEIFHAIQDQHFDINALLEPFSSKEHADFSLARMALIEGDATVLMFDYELYDQGVLPQSHIRSFIDVPSMAAAVLELDPMEMAAADQLEQTDEMRLGDDAIPSLTDSALGSAPPIIRDSLLFPYTEGMRFVVRARSGRSWSEFNAVYDDPPVSTSQILHPERYFEGVEPVTVDFEAGDALPDHDLMYETVFGELKIRSWLQTHLEETAEAGPPEEVAAGWRGDRIRGYAVSDGEPIVTHLSTWDTVDDARDFARSLEESARQRFDTRSTHRGGDHGEAWCLRIDDGDDAERIVVERWGELVLYLEGTPSQLDDQGRETDATTYLVREAVWDSHRREPFEETLEHQKSAESPEQARTSTTDRSSRLSAPKPPLPDCATLADSGQ